ncbi:AcrR family transcriptional regulator [Acetoanaerobium pronyense]|uniref:AcrR family transcriptional regulator n=1 Tax=Acetoanaerobium pronyense TaxID=1482736 RepID=A0ABS4KHC0_9FIRM|nr:TetR/AcrR family transcriptional regulator [Acetoanaerobium pronyense]MBP2027157.1 AcrR family transcriptional regulator [Acetoanaerobium pronyense]
MKIKQRKDIEKEEFKSLIFDIATEILLREGYENLSIRKIAKAAGYSPGSLYYYFDNKAEIISMIYGENVNRISEQMGKVPLDMESPEKTLGEILKIFINLTLETPEHYRAVFMNDIEELRDKFGMLSEDNVIPNLLNLINVGIENGRFKNADAAITSQLIWVYTNGLVSRLILEKNLSQERKEMIIDFHCETMKNLLLK